MNRLTATPPLPPGVYHRTPIALRAFPLAEEECRLFARARHGLWHALRALRLQAGDEVLVPAYHHGSEIEALTRVGLVCRFYGRGTRLEPTEAELAELLGPRTRALYLIHYLGFPQDARHWRSWCDGRGLLLLEDVAQSWFALSGGRPLGSFGDAALFCLYKTIGLPDGGAVVLRAAPQEPWVSANSVDAPTGMKRAARRHADWLLARQSFLGGVGGHLLKMRTVGAEQDFALGDVNLPPSRLTQYLLPRLADEQHIVPRRRTNYRLLLEALAEFTTPPFNELPEGAVPYAFPLETPDKMGLLRRLETAGIRAFNLWSTPHPVLPAADFPDAARRRAHVIGLPVHQELQLADVKRIVTAVKGQRTASPPSLHREPVESLDALGTEWDDLALAGRNIFATREWLTTWWRYFGTGQLHLSAWRDAAGKLVAILPLHILQRGPVRILRFLGHGVSDELGVICRREDRVRAAQALGQELARSKAHWDFFLGEKLPGDEPWAYLTGGRTLRRHPNPMIHTAGLTWDNYLGMLSTKFRKEIRYSESKLRRKHEFQFRTTQTVDQLSSDIETFLRLHEARWHEGSSLLPRNAFHRDVSVALLQRGWLRLGILNLDNVAVAARFDFRYAGVHAAYNAGRDPGWHRESVGLVLRVLMMRQAFEEGFDEYRFLSGGEGYKYRFGAVDRGLETIAHASGPVTEAALTTVRGLGALGPGRAFLSRAVLPRSKAAPPAAQLP
jgi:dTDP-4-amino-4,6-dideoxygalactose transaminase/CelD/BcsL family acetyltransferase involved in cellulose biosynthesis